MAVPGYSVFVLCLAGVIVVLSGGVESTGRFDFNATGLLRLPSDANPDGGIEVCAGSSRVMSCPATCFISDPVCGVNGVTYWCGCGDAACAGTKVAKLGFCEVENGGAGPQALLLLHIVWLIVVGFSVMVGAF